MWFRQGKIMGGVIGFTLRQEDGKEYRMSRWTNWTPWAIDNIELVRKSPKHIEEILQEWKEDASLPEGKKSWVYRYPFLAPSDYGLVVVDLLNNKILDCNGYHRFGETNISALSLELMTNGIDAFLDEKKGYDAARFYHFFKENRIKDALLWDVENKKFVSYGRDINQLSLEEFVDLISQDKSPLKYARFMLDMSPFEVLTFPESPKGFADFRQAVLDLGFVLTEEEKKLWDEKINPKDDD